MPLRQGQRVVVLSRARRTSQTSIGVNVRAGPFWPLIVARDDTHRAGTIRQADRRDARLEKRLVAGRLLLVCGAG